MPLKRTRSCLVDCIFQREIGLCSNLRDDLLKSFAEEKASLPNKNQPCEISGQTRATLLMEFSADGKRIASTHGDHSIRVTDIRTGKCTHTLNGHPRTPWCIAFHPSNNDILGSGCLGGEVRIWDLQGGGSEVWRCDSGPGIASMTFHPLDNVVVFAVSNKLHFWDWTRPEPFAICMTAHDFEKIRWVKFDRIGQRLLTAIANASDETFSDVLRFPFDDLLAEDSRYRRSGADEVTRLHRNSSLYRSLHHLHRMPINDDSLMDLRTQWSDNQNTFEQTRRLNNAQRYAYDVTNQAYRSSVDGRWNFGSDANLSPPLDHDGIIDRERNAASSSSDSRGFILPTISSPPLLSTSQNLDLPTTRLRELEARDALLSLAADSIDNHHTGFVLGLGRDDAHQRSTSGENLNLPEPGHVEMTPSTGLFVDLSERMVSASSSTVLGADQLSRAATLDRLPRRGATETNRRTDSNREVFRPGSHLSEIDLPSDSRTELTIDVQSALSGTERDAERSSDGLSDVWVDSSRNSDVDPSLSLFSVSNENLTETGNESQQTPGESGLDLRLHFPDGEARSAEERSCSLHALSFEDPSPASVETNNLPISENSSATASAVSQSPAVSGWLNEPCLNLTLLQSRTRRPSSDDSHEAPNDDGSARNAEARIDDSSSARCRIFPVGNQRVDSASPSASSATALASATSAAVGASFSLFRARREVRNHHSRAFDNPGHTRRNNCHGEARTNGHLFDCPARGSDPTTASCVLCSGTTSAQIFNSTEPQPSTSRGRAALSSHQLIDRTTDEEYPTSSFIQMRAVASVWPESDESVSREEPRGRLIGPSRLSLSSRPRLFQSADSFSSRDGPNDRDRVIPRIEILSDDLDERTRSADENDSPMQQGSTEWTRYLEPVVYRPTRFGGARTAMMSERLRERQERINFHVEELRTRFGSSSSTAGPAAGGGVNDDSARAAGLPDDIFAYRASPGFGAGAVGESIGNDDRDRIVSRLRGLREEMRALRHDRLSRSYRYNMPNRSLRSGRDSVLFGESDIQGFRVNAALNRAISGALAANSDGSVVNNIGDPTFRIQVWNFTRCQVPDISDSELNVLVRRAKIHNDANVDISQDGRYICTFTLPTCNFSGDITLGVFSLMPENFGECLFTKNFGANAVSVSLSPCNRYVLVGLATKRFTWMFTPKQMVAQIYRLNNPRAGEDSMEHVCDITHPCDTDFRAPISMNSARWLLGPGEGLAYGTNRGDMNICRPGFEQIEKPEVNDNLSESLPIRRNLMQMLGISVPRMMNSATQTSHNLRRSASTQTDQNAQSSSSSLANSTASSAVFTDDGNSLL